MNWLKRLWRLLPWVKKNELVGNVQSYQRASLEMMMNLQAFTSNANMKFKDIEKSS